MIRTALLLAALAAPVLARAQTAAEPNWQRIETETMQHFQALLRFDTSDPPGNEKPLVDYMRGVLEREGIPVEIFALEPNRPNLVARLRGSGARRPLLVMAHTDVVNVDPAKWRFPPFSATRDGGYVYGRGTLDDKDNVVAGLMTMLMLKRLNVPLDRDVIFLAEAGEEGSTRIGIEHVVNSHWSSIDAEYCLAEGGSVSRRGGEARFAAVQTVEKNPRGIQLTARGPAGHGSVPLTTNAIVHLSSAVSKLGAWRAPLRLNETTREYFTRLASISAPEDAARYRAILAGGAARAEADAYFVLHEPRHASMLRTSVSPNIIQGGYRVNVIPSEARATLDVRVHPDDDADAFLAELRKVIDDPAVELSFVRRSVRPKSPPVPLDTDAFRAIEAAARKHYGVVTLPTMSTGATDMSYLRARGMRCYGIGPAVDAEDGPLGFGGHSDQERILESELHRFVRFKWDVVNAIAGRR